MFVFIVPVKSSRLSRISWEFSSKVLERCLKSVCNQTSQDFRVLIVHHEKPEIAFHHPLIDYMEVDFPIPSWDEPSTLYRDKGRKLWVGLNYARQFNPNFVMLVDSDDCVNRSLVDYTHQHSSQNGWFIADGFEYPDGSGRVYHRKHKFHLKCGTSHIMQWNLLLPYANLAFEEVTDRFLWHQDLVQLMANQGTPLSRLPFNGAVYISDTGENHDNLTELFVKQFQSNVIQLGLFWARRTYKSLNSLAVSDQMRHEFSLYDL